MRQENNSLVFCVRPLILRATLALRSIVARVESRRRHHGSGGGLFGAQPTPVWPCKLPSKVALHGTARCRQTDLVRISIRHLATVILFSMQICEDRAPNVARGMIFSWSRDRWADVTPRSRRRRPIAARRRRRSGHVTWPRPPGRT